MKVKIINMDTEKSYLAESEGDCIDEVDKFAYKACVSHKDIITVGIIIARPQT